MGSWTFFGLTLCNTSRYQKEPRVFASHTSQDIFDILTEHQLLWCRFTFMSGTLLSNEGSCASMKDSEDTHPKRVRSKNATRALILKNSKTTDKLHDDEIYCVDRSFIPARNIIKCLLVYFGWCHYKMKRRALEVMSLITVYSFRCQQVGVN